MPISILVSCISSWRFFISSSCTSAFFAVLSPIVAVSATSCIVEFIFSVATVSSSISFLYFCTRMLFCLMAFVMSAKVAHNALKFSILVLFRDLCCPIGQSFFIALQCFLHNLNGQIVLVLALQPAEEHWSVVFQRVLEWFSLRSCVLVESTFSNRLLFSLSIVSLGGAIAAISSWNLSSIVVEFV